MISSPQPNKATPNSDPDDDKHSMAKINEQLSPYPQEALDVNEPHSRQDAENLIRNGQKQKAHQEVPRRRQGLSLKNKATALAIVLSTIPVLLIGATAYYFADKTLAREINQQKRQRATGIADEINRFMSERYGDIQIMASLPTLRNPKVRAVTTPQEKQAALNRFLDAYGLYDSIAVADLAGNTIVQSLGEPVTGFGERDYFKEVIKTNSSVIVPPRKSAVTGEYSIFMAAPIVDSATGKTIGVIRSSMPIKFIEEIVGKSSTRGDKYHLFDASGKYFLISRGGEQKLVGTEAKAEYPSITQLQARRQVASQVMTNSQNAKELVAYAPFQKLAGFPDLNWNVLLTTDTAIAFAAQRQLLLTLAIGTVLTALLVSAIAAYLANRATRPIVAAAGVVEKLGQGELDTRIAVEGQDELATLGSNINRMAGQMQTLLQSQAVEAERAQLTRDITLHIGQSLNSKEILNTAVQEIRLAIKTDRVVVYSFNEIWQGTVTVESVADNWPCALGAQIDDPCLAQQYVERYRQGRIKATENIHTAGLNKCYLKQLEAFAVKASIIAPIMQGGELLGLLVAHQCDRPRAWEQSEIDLFAQLAIQVGFALDKANLLDQQRTVKEQLQRRALELLMEVDPVSRGDLTIRANVTEDEIGTIADSYNATIESLRKVVTQVQAAAKQVTTTTSSSEASVQDLSAEALRQTEEITVALDRLQEMSTSIRAVAANAQQAEAAVQQANQTVVAGDAAMNRTVDGILAIQETVAQTSTKVQRLGESSQKISKVVKLISAFADQTNLLALNAAIEAARAGDEGRGFAVIADEVQSLAQQSALATAEIESLVTDIQTETNSVAAAMATGTLQVATGTQLVDETRQSLNKITAVSAQISALVEAIALATVAQTHASESVTQTMTDVAAIAFSTSNEATLVSASFKELLAVATELQTSAAQFKVS